MNKFFPALLLVLVTLPPLAKAGTPLDSQFKTKGTASGWTAPVGVKNFGIAKSGYLGGTAASNDPQLYYTSGVSKADDEVWGVITVRLRQLDASGVPVEFNETGLMLIFGGTQFRQPTFVKPDRDHFFILSYDLVRVVVNNSGSIRFDPIGNTMSEKGPAGFEIDYIQANTVPIK